MGVVYLLQHGDTSLYKIGRARESAQKRKRQGLSTGNPETLHIIHSWNCGDEAAGFESRVHTYFAANRLYDREATEFFNFDNVALTVDIIHDLHAEYMTYNDDLVQLMAVPQISDELKDMDDEIFQLIQLHRSLQADIKEKTYRCCLTDTKIKAFIGTQAGTGRPGATKPTVTWQVQTADRLDQTLLKTRYPEIYKECLKKTSSRVFRIH